MRNNRLLSRTPTSRRTRTLTGRCFASRRKPGSRFPVPSTGIVQRIAADLLACLPSMAAIDQHDARFVLCMAADWLDLDDDTRNIVFKRLNIYTIVATYGWPTAIASSTAVQATPTNYLLPPGVHPVQHQRGEQGPQRNQKQWGNRRRQPAQAPAPDPVQPPAPASAAARGRGGGRRRS